VGRTSIEAVGKDPAALGEAVVNENLTVLDEAVVTQWQSVRRRRCRHGGGHGAGARVVGK
jgi:hypothetical protein